jgi:probable rRNA maturation factor
MIEITLSSFLAKTYGWTPPALRQRVKDAIHKTFCFEKIPLTHFVHVAFLTDPEIRKLNKTFRNIDRATDILSFPMEEWIRTKGEKSHFYLGDLVISLETAARNAKRYRTSLPDELRRLLIHGTLHLLGYDHQKSHDRTLMRSHEHFILIG